MNIFPEHTVAAVGLQLPAAWWWECSQALSPSVHKQGPVALESCANKPSTWQSQDPRAQSSPAPSPEARPAWSQEEVGRKGTPHLWATLPERAGVFHSLLSHCPLTIIASILCLKISEGHHSREGASPLRWPSPHTHSPLPPSALSPATVRPRHPGAHR